MTILPISKHIAGIWIGLSLLMMGHVHAVTLIQKGVAHCSVVTAPHPSPEERHAAEELATYLRRMSGATVSVSLDGTGTGVRILVGRIAIWRHPEITHDLQQGPISVRDQGFVQRLIERDIALVGATPRATQYAVYDFLERLGCRWFMPGPFGEVVPKKRTIEIGPLNRISYPDFPVRYIWYDGAKPVTSRERREFETWKLRNKMSELNVSAGHNMHCVLPLDRFYKEHPEYYALRNGQRVKDHPCTSNMEGARAAAEVIKEYFRAHPDATSFSISQEDGIHFCECDQCIRKNLGLKDKQDAAPDISETYYAWINEVAREVAKEFPDKTLGCLAYVNTIRPPLTVDRIEPNVWILLAPIAHCPMHVLGDPKCWQRVELLQYMREWGKRSDHVILYDYDPSFLVLPGIPDPVVANLKHDVPLWKEAGLVGICTEGRKSWLVVGMNFYVRAKMTWDADVDVDSLMTDYHDKLYGKAARPIQRFHDALQEAKLRSPLHQHEDEILKDVWPLEFLYSLKSLIEEAEQAAPTDWEREHVRVERLSYESLIAYANMRAAGDRGYFANAVAWADRQMAVLKDIQAVDSTLFTLSEWVGETPSQRAAYQEQADRAGGKLGDLVTLLPDVAAFKTDPHDEGIALRWFDVDLDETDWRPICTTRIWEGQGLTDERGYGYDGVGWYRMRVTVPEAYKGRRILLYCGGVFERAWYFINGRLAFYKHHPGLWWEDYHYGFEFDATPYLKVGAENQITVRVFNRWEWGGLFRRSFLWSPSPDAQENTP